jgi:hypothetical protein
MSRLLAGINWVSQIVPVPEAGKCGGFIVLRLFLLE